MEEVDVLGLLSILHLSNIAPSLLPTARLTVTSNEPAPLGSICLERRTRVDPLSSGAYARSRA